MANTAANVIVGVTGSFYGAPDGTALPTTTVAALDEAFVDLGYISESGLVQSENTATTDIVAFQNAAIVRKIQTSHDLTYALEFMESSPAVLEAIYGNEDAGTVEIKGEQGTRQSWVFDVLDGTKKVRLVIPDGQITEKGDVSFVNGNAVIYPVTITCYPDTSDVKAYRYDGAAA